MAEGESTRRNFLRTGTAIATVGLAGCTGFFRGSDIKDTDGDGVIDSEDYAPRDSAVQKKSDLIEPTSTATPTEATRRPPSTGVIEDFEDGTVRGWESKQGKDPDLFAVTSDTIHGEYAGQLRFQAHVWLSFTPTTASELSFWFRSGAFADNELTFSFHESTGDGWASMETAGFGVEAGAENQRGLFVNPPFPNGKRYRVLYERPQPNTWYQVRFVNIDFATGRFDVVLYDATGTEIGRVTNHRIANGVRSISRIQINNSMNFTRSSAAIDNIRIA